MKRYLLFLGFGTLLFSCHSTEKGSTANEKEVPVQKDLENFADSLVRLDKYSLPSINTATRYYKELVPADTTLADSAAVMILKHSWTAVDSLNQKLYNDTTDYFELVYNQSENVPQKQKLFQQQLASQHIKLQGDGEGGVYAVLDYDWIVPVLQEKTSVRTDTYLSLLAREEKEPALLDAGLAIEMEELVKRTVISENLLSLPLPKLFKDDVTAKNKFYTGVLINGSDNTPSLAYDSFDLTEEFKKGYDFLLLLTHMQE